MRRLLLAFVAVSAATMSGCQTLNDVSNSLTSAVGSVRGALTGSSDTAGGSPQSSDEAQSSGPSGSLAAAPDDGIVSATASADAVIDGDTLVLRGRRIRLFGIDAPEAAQQCQVSGSSVPCGSIAKHALVGLVAGTTVQCERKDTDRYGRDVSLCSADGYNVSAGMVRNGMAVAYRRYSLQFVPEEEEAKSAKRGIWKGQFTMPWDWRAQHRT